jgi:hypothetical protein
MLNNHSILLILCLFNISLAIDNPPSIIFSRLNPLWTDEVVFTNKTIGYRPDVLDLNNSLGVQIVLLATSFRQYNIKCDGIDCNPTTLVSFIQNCALKHCDFNKVMKIKGAMIYHKSYMNWPEVHKFSLVKTQLFFITEVKSGCGSAGGDCNYAGNLYEVDLDKKVVKYYDDLGAFGEFGFDDIDIIGVTLYDLTDEFKFLE